MQITPLDKTLISDSKFIVKTARYINYNHNPEITLFAVRLLHHLSVRQVRGFYGRWRSFPRHSFLRNRTSRRICSSKGINTCPS